MEKAQCLSICCNFRLSIYLKELQWEEQWPGVGQAWTGSSLQGPKHLDYLQLLFPGLEKGGGLEVEQPIWDVGGVAGSFTHYAMMLALKNIFESTYMRYRNTMTVLFICFWEFCTQEKLLLTNWCKKTPCKHASSLGSNLLAVTHGIGSYLIPRCLGVSKFRRDLWAPIS